MLRSGSRLIILHSKQGFGLVLSFMDSPLKWKHQGILLRASQNWNCKVTSFWSRGEKCKVIRCIFASASPASKQTYPASIAIIWNTKRITQMMMKITANVSIAPGTYNSSVTNGGAMLNERVEQKCNATAQGLVPFHQSPFLIGWDKMKTSRGVFELCGRDQSRPSRPTVITAIDKPHASKRFARKWAWRNCEASGGEGVGGGRGSGQ